MTYLLHRLWHAALVLVVVCCVTFFVVRLAPGGPSLLADPKLTAPERVAIEARLGLDRSLPEQFARFAAGALRGDLGVSFLYGTPVVEVIASRLPGTLLLAGSALLLTALIAVPLGLICGMQPGSRLDQALSALSMVLVAVPVFWLALMLIIAFAVTLRWLPAGGMNTPGQEGEALDTLRHLLLPTVVLAGATVAEVLRYTRSSALSVRAMDYVRTARAKGVGPGRVLYKHVLRNALLPVLTALGLQLPRLVGGAAVTETLFAWPGMGRLSVEAALGRDYPLIVAITLTVALAVVLFNLLIDLLYPWIDPRVRGEG